MKKIRFVLSSLFAVLSAAAFPYVWHWGREVMSHTYQVGWQGFVWVVCFVVLAGCLVLALQSLERNLWSVIAGGIAALVNLAAVAVTYKLNFYLSVLSLFAGLFFLFASISCIPKRKKKKDLSAK